MKGMCSTLEKRIQHSLGSNRDDQVAGYDMGSGIGLIVMS
jgi:hypothetical protein